MESDYQEIYTVGYQHSVTQFSDGSASTITASPALSSTQRCSCYKGLLCPHHRRDSTLDGVQQPSNDTPSHLPSSFSFDRSNSPSSIKSAAITESPSWEESPRSDHWGFRGIVNHPSRQDDQRRLLRPLSRDNSSSRKSKELHGHISRVHCISSGSHEPRGRWFPVFIMVLSSYSTVLSGIWLILAIKKQDWGNLRVGKVAPSTILSIFPLLAKSVELSFVTVFAVSLGQRLSLRATSSDPSKGITLAEMSMRMWVLQPGTIFSEVGNIGHKMLSSLGMMSVCAALLATLYTSASDVLVGPKVKFGVQQSHTLKGNVSTSFANADYIVDQCQTPVSPQMDPISSGISCIEIEHSGQALHNYMQYLTQWSWKNTSIAHSSDLAKRPKPVAMLDDNIVVTGQWIDITDMVAASNTHKRMINNVSMAFPHAGIPKAAHDPKNKIMQPSDLENVGEYHLAASVPSPSINVICSSNKSEQELDPFIYNLWPDAANVILDATNWPYNFTLPQGPGRINATNFDDIFEFGARYNRTPPIFPKLPLPYNTVLGEPSSTGDSLYLLGAGPTSAAKPIPEFVICSLRSSLTASCSTRYNASLQGGTLYTNCEDSDPLIYGKRHHDASNGPISQDWVKVATRWAQAVALSGGLSDSSTANARLLTQLIPTGNTLNSSLPSIAEALAVMAGCILLLSSLDAPFVHHWNYTTPNLSTPVPQWFETVVQSKEYMSGGLKPWQESFYVVLGLTFVFNCGCLCYLAKRLVTKDRGFVTDFTEPQNTFSLALNSPPSQNLAGPFGGGPSKEQYKQRWWIRNDTERDRYYFAR